MFGLRKYNPSKIVINDLIVFRVLLAATATAWKNNNTELSRQLRIYTTRPPTLVRTLAGGSIGPGKTSLVNKGPLFQ